MLLHCFSNLMNIARILTVMQLESFNVSNLLHKYIKHSSVLWSSSILVKKTWVQMSVLKFRRSASASCNLHYNTIIRPLIYWQHRNNMEPWLMGKSPNKPWDVINPWRFLMIWFLPVISIWTKCISFWITSILVLYPLACGWIL